MQGARLSSNEADLRTAKQRGNRSSWRVFAMLPFVEDDEIAGRGPIFGPGMICW